MESYDELRANGDSFFLRGPTAERVSQVPSPKPGGKTPDYLRGLVDEEVSVRVGVGESQRWFWSGPGERRLRRTVLGSSTRPPGETREKSQSPEESTQEPTDRGRPRRTKSPG